VRESAAPPPCRGVGDGSLYLTSVRFSARSGGPVALPEDRTSQTELQIVPNSIRPFHEVTLHGFPGNTRVVNLVDRTSGISARFSRSSFCQASWVQGSGFRVEGGTLPTSRAGRVRTWLSYRYDQTGQSLPPDGVHEDLSRWQSSIHTYLTDTSPLNKSGLYLTPIL